MGLLDLSDPRVVGLISIFLARGEDARLGDSDGSRGLPRLGGEVGRRGGLRGLFDFFDEGFLVEG